MEKKPAVLFLFDYSGIIAEPWLDSGYIAYSIDGQHPAGITNKGNHYKIGLWIDPYKKLETIQKIKNIIQTDHKILMVFGFPECTDLTVAGARHFKQKRADNELFQIEAAEQADLIRCLGVLFNCPWAFENPVSVLSTQYRAYDFNFNPADYGGYLPENDKHPYYEEIYPPQDAYNKNTCIWHGNGFKEPKKKPVKVLNKDNPGWQKLGGKSLRTKRIRSATPRGFSLAVKLANSK